MLRLQITCSQYSPLEASAVLTIVYKILTLLESHVINPSITLPTTTYNVDRASCGNEHLPYADIQGPFSAFMPCPDVSIDKAQRGWNVLVFVLRWWFSIRRIMARRTRDRELPGYCE